MSETPYHNSDDEVDNTIDYGRGDNGHALSQAAIDHETATLSRGEQPSAEQVEDEASDSPTQPMNTGNGWRKGNGTDMI